MANLGYYLDFPLIQGRAAKDKFDYISKKMHRRLLIWKGNLLNITWRACLARLVTTTMPTYIMQLHYLPTNICDKTSRKWNIVKWSIVTFPKKFGGLAIREVKPSNTSLSRKLVWNLLCDPHKLGWRFYLISTSKVVTFWTSKLDETFL